MPPDGRRQRTATRRPRRSRQSNVIQLSGRARRWRNVATLTTAIAAALVGDDRHCRLYQPDLLPEGIRPKPRTQVVEVKTAASRRRPAQFVALLQKDGSSPAFILTVDGDQQNFTVRKVGAPPEPGKSYELWLVSDKLQRPRSLGVIGGNDFTARPVLCVLRRRHRQPGDLCGDASSRRAARRAARRPGRSCSPAS